MTALLEAARAKRDALAAEVAAVRAEEQDGVASAIRDKLPIGDGYWQVRWLTEQRLHAAEALVTALEEAGAA